VADLIEEVERERKNFESLAVSVSGIGAASAAAPVEDDCVICFDGKREVAVTPCGHVCFCKDCAVAYKKEKLCPTCRSPITSLVRIFN